MNKQTKTDICHMINFSYVANCSYSPINPRGSVLPYVISYVGLFGICVHKYTDLYAFVLFSDCLKGNIADKLNFGQTKFGAN